jgi:hypothetical protein
MTTSLPFDLCDPDGLVFDEDPHLFVDLSPTPIVFTIRGARYFSPRFRWVGFEISRIETREAFDQAFRSWLPVEFELLQEQIASRARPGALADPYNALLALMAGDDDAFERHMTALERRGRSGMHLVPPKPR